MVEPKKKKKFSHHLFILVWLKTCMSFCVLHNTHTHTKRYYKRCWVSKQHRTLL